MRLSQLLIEMSVTIVESSKELVVEQTEEEIGQVNSQASTDENYTSRVNTTLSLEGNSSVKSELRNPFADYEEEDEHDWCSFRLY